MNKHLPKEIIFEIQLNGTRSEYVTCYEHNNNTFKCKSENHEAIIEFNKDFQSYKFKTISIDDKPIEYFNRAELILKDIKELNEEYNVTLSFEYDIPTIKSCNEGGYNSTHLDLDSLITYLVKNFPDKIKEKLI